MAYTIDEAKEEVIRAGIELLKSGLIARTWGNISARVSDTQFVITPSGKGYDSLTPDDIVLVNIEDCSYEGSVKPSSEKGVHAKCYALRPEVNFVIHTHQLNASALSILGRDLPLPEDVEEEKREILGPQIPCATYGLSSTKKLTNAVATALEEHPHCNSVLMRYHGAVCVGADYDSAFKVAYTLEDVAGKIYEDLTGEPLATEAGESERKDSDNKFGLWVRTPYIVKISQMGKEMPAYIDDLAQIAGKSIRCAGSNPSQRELADMSKDREAVFVKDDGAVCYGVNLEEAEAVAMVLEKACRAAYLGYKEKVPGVDKVSAVLERTIYVKKYSKLK